jgi:sulfide:quinone oxidoreductase
MNFGAIEGLRREDLGRGNVHCIYDYASAQKCWAAIQRLAETGGRAYFTDTWTKLKCGGAPKKINMIAEDYLPPERNAGPRRPPTFYSGGEHV